MEIVFDLEANGLNLPQYDKKKGKNGEWMAVADRVWCVMGATVDNDTQFGTYKAATRPPSWLDKATTLIGHNIIGYDLPLLKRLYGWEPKEGTRIVDTLILSRLLNSDRGSHSLSAWGERLGYNKGKYEEGWDKYTPEMLTYCQRDVELTRRLYHHLMEEMGDWDWDEAVKLEHSFATIMQRQEENGVYFDMGAALTLESKISKEIDEIDNGYDLPAKYKQVGTTVTRPFKINGDLAKRVLDWIDWDTGRHVKPMVCGTFSKIERIPLNLGSDKQVKDYLLTQGWIPTQYNSVDGIATSPKLTEDSFGTIQGDFGQKLLRRRVCAHKLSQLKGLIKNVRPDGRITAAANTIGTPTGRCRHRIVVNIPSIRAPFGVELRSLFTVPDGYVMVGHDAEQIELRLLAHYMGDEKYIEAVLNGDIHTYNQELAGILTRDDAKTFIYAFIYGAGDGKLGSIVGGGTGKGSSIRKRFLKGLPKLKDLIEQVKHAAERGYLVGLDGRKIWMRRDSEGRVMLHKALNTLIQCADSVVMKQSAIILDEAVRESGDNYKKVIDMHDEAQAEVIEHEAEGYALMAEWSIEAAGEHFNLRLPMKGKTKIGKNWYETH